MNDNTDQSTIESYWNGFVDFLPEFFWALVILFVANQLGKLVHRYIKKLMNRVVEHKSVTNLVSRLSQIVIIVVGSVFALKVLNLDGAVGSLLAGAGIIGLALGFAFQDIAANFIAGIIISVQNKFNVGDLIEIDDIFGTIKNIELRTTEVQTLQGQIVFVPNKDIFTSKVSDYSSLGQRRIDLTCGVSYSDDLEKVENVAIKAIKKVENINDAKPIDLYFEEFGDSSINFTVRFWVKFDKQTDFLRARSSAIKNIKSEFDKNNISIPFPITTVKLDK